jgi:hypothetical protein
MAKGLLCLAAIIGLVALGVTGAMTGPWLAFAFGWLAHLIMRLYAPRQGGAQVSINGPTGGALTVADGRYVIANVPSGAITVALELPSALDDKNPSDIERIEVVKGSAGGTLYGADAADGVINIKTKPGGAKWAAGRSRLGNE